MKDGISRRGFASMSEERRKEIASMGGKSAHKIGKAHKFTSKEASIAGKISAARRWGKEPAN
jgi:hypothetical protein